MVNIRKVFKSFLQFNLLQISGLLKIRLVFNTIQDVCSKNECYRNIFLSAYVGSPLQIREFSIWHKVRRPTLHLSCICLPKILTLPSSTLKSQSPTSVSLLHIALSEKKKIPFPEKRMEVRRGGNYLTQKQKSYILYEAEE